MCEDHCRCPGVCASIPVWDWCKGKALECSAWALLLLLLLGFGSPMALLSRKRKLLPVLDQNSSIRRIPQTELNSPLFFFSCVSVILQSSDLGQKQISDLRILRSGYPLSLKLSRSLLTPVHFGGVAEEAALLLTPSSEEAGQKWTCFPVSRSTQCLVLPDPTSAPGCRGTFWR